MTNLIQYHPNTNDMAVFESDGAYWIGVYGPFLTHQNGEPMYYAIDGYWDNAADAIAQMNKLTGNEI